MADVRPRLRPLELFPVDVDGQDLICIRDPSGLTERVGFFPRPAALAAVLCDGSRTLAEVAAEVARRAGIEVEADQIAQLIEQLDDGLFLESPRLEAHRTEVLAAFRSTRVRAASHAGGAYSAEPEALRTAMSSWGVQIASESAPATLHAEPGRPALLVSPHIDYHRGFRTYARAWRAVPSAGFDLVVILGTDHNGTEWPFTLTRKSYATPLGELATDVALVDELVGRLPFHADGLFADELHHRNEHSIELQAVWLAHIFGGAAPPVLPVLCGSLHRSIDRGESPSADPRIAGFLGALRAATAERRILVIAGADFAHVGPRFGDGAMGADDRRRVEDDDRRSLVATAARDAEGFFGAIADIKDRNRVCGLAPIYHALAFAGREGRPGEIIAYDQCHADEAGTSFVSIAALAM
jgi:AmmeMemoRadiSam system protein B